MAGLDNVLLVCFELLLMAAALSDARSFRIPNLIPAALLGVFAILILAGGARSGVVSALAAFGLAFAFGAGLWWLRVWGGGDVKLLAAVAPFVGLAGLPRLIAVMALAGGVLALGVLLKARLSLSGAERPRHLPYGIAIAAAGTDWLVKTLA
jgi:prepilin peptidase CpaA